MSLTISKYHRKHRFACTAIFARAWAQTFPAYPRDIDVDAFERETRDEIILIAEDHGAVLGFAAFYAPDNFLHHLFVDPAFQGRGVGAALIGAIKPIAMAPISLKCSVGNTNARAFYARLGFTQGETGEDTYGQWIRLTAPAL
jgi:GNAT superfamily N-acetyltransferase